MKYLYRIYQLFICLPLFLLTTILTATMTVIGCALGAVNFFGYHPGRLWSRITIYSLLLPIHVEGREHLKRHQSYVFVANHQGAFDIFIIYGFLGRNFKWLMKQSLRRIPFVGVACEYARHIFVDKSGPSKIRQTYDRARNILKGGMSVVVFPEGSRTRTGAMGRFQRGAFMLADELQLSVVPLTINGSFNVLPRQKDGHFVNWHPLSLTIHEPIPPSGQGPDNIHETMQKSYEAVLEGLAGRDVNDER